MNAALDAETLAMLDESMVRFARTQYEFGQRRAWLGQGRGFSPERWRDYGELGWLALALPAEHGGFGDDPRATGRLMEYVGRSLALEPVFASAVQCAHLLGEGADPRTEQWRAVIASGEQILALAHAENPNDVDGSEVRTSLRNGRVTGEKRAVLHGDVADRVLVSARDADSGDVVIACVDPMAAGVAVKRLKLVDGRSAAEFCFAEAEAEAVIIAPDAASRLAHTLDYARLALCSEIYGAASALQEATLEHLKTRRQFGRPLGANQALAHRMTDLHVLREELRAVIDTAELAFDASSIERARAVSATAAHALTVARQTAHEAVQMHGGMGITDELSASHYFRRLMVCTRLIGDREWHLARFAAATSEAGDVA